jgi:AcrR family transcriptional regulator
VPPTKRRTPELRDHILDVALGVLDAEGVDAITTRHVAALADTSAAAIYELFDHKAGLVRELFFAGFRQLGAEFEHLGTTGDPIADLTATIRAFRSFAIGNPNRFDVMYNRPFELFEPDGDERALGDGTRRFLVGRVERCVAAGMIDGDATDIAHALLGLAIGLATQENAGWLGSTPGSRDRRWALAVDAFVRGVAPPT